MGGGVSGLVCARTLQRAGIEVRVFDKARRPGGRISTRRIDDDATFDHGAQYFTARDPAFVAEVAGWEQAGVVGSWSPRLVSLGADGAPPSSQRWVGTPTMSAIARHLAWPVPVQAGVRVGSVAREGTGWRLADDAGGALGTFEQVVLALPAAQAVPLLADAPRLQSRADAVEMTPCWAAMISFAHAWPVDFDAAFVAEAPVSWAARDSSKPGRAPGERWVLHGAPGWSEQHWDDEPDAVAAALLAAMVEATSTSPPPLIWRGAHRWRYALPTRVDPEPFLHEPELGIGACGDWCGGPRLEGAFLSGAALGNALVAGLAA